MNKENISHELRAIIADELNVKLVDFAEATVDGGFVEKADGEVKVWLDTKITEELKKEGWLREIVRSINQLRKEAGLTINDRITVRFVSDKSLAKWITASSNEIQSATLAEAVVESGNIDGGTTLDFDGATITVGIQKK